MNSSQEELAYEKARFEYCHRLFDQENKKKESLENKATFHLSYITIVLGAIVLNADFLKLLQGEIAKVGVSTILKITIRLSMSIWLISILISLASIFILMSLKKYRDGYPRDLVDAMFHPDSMYLEKKDELNFVRTVALDYAISLECNRSTNEQKSNWLNIANFSILLSVAALSLFLIASAYLFIA